jgi:3-hydroxyisobutyrate dehydrogenase-like beta-hydroxyacid dehydrogenase
VVVPTVYVGVARGVRMAPDIDTVGVVGVGTIGRNFVDFLVDGGYETVVYDVAPEPVADAVDAGALAAENAAAVAERASVTLLSLPGREYVEQAMEGEDGVLAGVGAGDVVVDTGTTPPDADVYYAERCAERGAGYVDAPLTFGGPGGWDDGSPLNMFVGGREADYERVREVLETVSYDHRRYGGVGAGHVVKAGHRMYQNCTEQVLMEFAEYLYNNGVDPGAFDEQMGVGIDDRVEREVYPSARGFHGALAGEETVADERGYRVEAGDSGPPAGRKTPPTPWPSRTPRTPTCRS